MAKKHRTVFISSTFEDLKTHRKEVWDRLNKYDVNIRGMEKFGARKEAPIETCLSEVEQSDIFIGIISLRLGSIDKKTAKSFVQCEYDRALDLDKDIYIYLIDEHEGNVNPAHIDFGENHEKLNAFKSILKERHTVDTFKSAVHLAEKLDAKFEELLLSKKQDKAVNDLDEYSKAKDLMGKFLLLPNTYSDRQIRLRIEVDGEPFAASKAICESFYLPYGSTLGVRIKIIEPIDTGDEFRYLFVTEREVEDFFDARSKGEIEVIVVLKFSSDSIDTIKAHFESRTFLKMSPLESMYSASVESAMSNLSQPEIHTEQGEGQIILQLKSVIKSD